MILAAVGGMPEAPNALTLIRDYFKESHWTQYLQDFEAVIFSIFIALIVSLLFYFGSRKREMLPTGLQNAMEYFVENFRNFIVGVIGREGERYVPFLGTLFIYILFMNVFGVIPLMKSPSSSLDITAALAICVFCYVQYLNIKNMGVGGFLHHLAGSPKSVVQWVLVPLMLPIEILTQVSRPVTLALRLFGNIVGEKILVGFFAMASVLFFYFFPIQLPFMFLGLLTGIMQALVFTLLSTIYISLSLPHHEEHHQLQH